MRAGMMISEIAFSNMPVLLKNAGIEFCILDCEHGGFDYAEVSRLIMTARLCGLELIVRLANNERKDVVKYLDMGADGLLLPMTNTAEDIRKVADYAKYPPLGHRGISTMRAHTLYAPPPVLEYMPAGNARTKIFAQAETRAGVENIDRILAVPGVSGCFIGPNDLSADYECLGDPNAPPILKAIERVGEAAAAAGKISGMITANKNYLSKAKSCRFTAFCVGSELNAIAEYGKKTARLIKE
ncbi:MAG: hypothetical protein KH054_03210 [Firmicutes bacterium]|jgi:hypothetical protein|nr:hypothetical protein [Bacillota bacterium]